MEKFLQMGDECDSDGEDISISSKGRLRRMNVVAPGYMAPPVPEKEWSYRPSVVSQPQHKRSGSYFDSDRVRESLAMMERSLLDYKVPQLQAASVEETKEGMTTSIDLGNGNVESPGGSVVCTLPIGIFEKVNLGQVLQWSEFMRFITAYRVDKGRFVRSKLFDSFSGPWESVLRSLLDEEVIASVVRSGMATDVYEFVNRLRARFSLEVVSVLSQSNVYKRRFFRVFNRIPSTDSLMEGIRTGHFNNIAQSDKFLERVMMLKELIDRVLIRAESQNVYLPTYITQAQRGLPVRGHAPLGVLGTDMAPMPRRVEGALIEDGRMRQHEHLRNRFVLK